MSSLCTFALSKHTKKSRFASALKERLLIHRFKTEILIEKMRTRFVDFRQILDGSIDFSSRKITNSHYIKTVRGACDLEKRI